MLVPMRMASEGLSARDAVDRVFTDNLHGLELDARCVEIAVFALALAAWRYPDEDGNPLGVRADMPAPQVACCGLKVAAKASDWEALVPSSQPDAQMLRQELRLLHASFAQAPLLGSLLDPARTLKNDLATSSYDTLRSLLERALATEIQTSMSGHEQTDEAWELALTARGLLDAARLLDRRYDLVVTNVPYLSRGKHSDELKRYCDKHCPTAKYDLSTVFVERCHELCSAQGVFALVSPQNWWFLQSYAQFRPWLLTQSSLHFAISLGEEAWEYFGDRGPLATLMICSARKPSEEHRFGAMDVISTKQLSDKKSELQHGRVHSLTQRLQLKNPDARIVLVESQFKHALLQKFASGLQGVSTSDNPRFRQGIWEQASRQEGWSLFQGSPTSTGHFGGCDSVVWMEKLLVNLEGAQSIQDSGSAFEDSRNASRESGVYLRGQAAWGHGGVAIRQMRDLPAALYLGSPFDTNTAVILPTDASHLPAIWCYCSSSDFAEEIRRVDQKVNVTNATMVKVPFDLERWTKIAETSYPNGLPKPYSDDATQWFFHGHPKASTDPLQVALARLLGYRWPAESDVGMELSDEARIWVANCGKLAGHVDDDGIVCLPSVRGEKPAHERLLALLIAAWETVQSGSWRPAILDKLLLDADCSGKGLDVWLREKFFEQHSKLFHHRPFVWHLWDGLKDGFGALVNYHKLDAKSLERLVHTYLGDWIRQQEAGVRSGADGASTRLVAAQELKRRLELILEGEAPYDIFVRWKALAEQPIGWSPDPNDGVRLNIRPFVSAEVLRHNKKPKLNISWDKDRGKDGSTAPWFKVFKGERINDHHLTLDEKHRARLKT